MDIMITLPAETGAGVKIFFEAICGDLGFDNFPEWPATFDETLAWALPLEGLKSPSHRLVTMADFTENDAVRIRIVPLDADTSLFKASDGVYLLDITYHEDDSWAISIRPSAEGARLNDKVLKALLLMARD